MILEEERNGRVQKGITAERNPERATCEKVRGDNGTYRKVNLIGPQAGAFLERKELVVIFIDTLLAEGKL